jgi:hypothetical protein
MRIVALALVLVACGGDDTGPLPHGDPVGSACSGGFTFKPVRTAIDAIDLALVDLDRDRRDELIVLQANFDGTFVAVWHWPRDGSTPLFADERHSVGGGIGIQLSIASADADDLPDAIVTGSMGYVLHTMTGGTLGDPEGPFTADGVTMVDSGDFDGDGRIDLVTASTALDNVSLLDDTRGTFATKTSLAISKPIAIAAANVTGDGALDIVVSDGMEPHVDLLEGHGDGTFADPRPIALAGGPIALRDFDGDGMLDLANAGAGAIDIRLGDGAGTFTRRTTVPGPMVAGEIVTADVDGDGNLDMFVSGADTISLLWGDGNGGFAPPQLAHSGQHATFAVGDLDGDGHLDLVVHRGTALVLFGRCAPP